MELHVLTDVKIQNRFSHYELAKAAFDAGAHAVQLREKELSKGEMCELARMLAAIPRKPFQKLIINDFVDVALESGTDGVHLGAEDMHPADAREILGPDKIIGLTVHDKSELEAGNLLPVDYFGIGPVFGTRSKALALPALGPEGLAELAAGAARPVIAIGGIGTANAQLLKNAGIHGIAVLGAVSLSKDPASIVKELLQIFQ